MVLFSEVSQFSLFFLKASKMKKNCNPKKNNYWHNADRNYPVNLLSAIDFGA